MSNRRPYAYDLTGRRFGRLVVVTAAGVASNGGLTWLCDCDCGSSKVIASDSLRRGLTSSCGCAQKEHAAARKATHLQSYTPEYKAWKAIKQRCFNSKCASFSDYGARGVTMCAEWVESFEAFLNAVGQRPSPLHSIDRRNNDRGYEPGNCRWALPVEQLNNRRNNVLVHYDGRTFTVAEISRLLNISSVAIRSKIRRGISSQHAFEQVAIKGGIRV